MTCFSELQILWLIPIFLNFIFLILYIPINRLILILVYLIYIQFLFNHQVLSPITTARGNCHSITRIKTITLIAVCAISCIIPNFTDSFRDSAGKLHYSVATFTGIFVFDRTAHPPDQNKYRIRASDFVHAFTSLAIFMAVVSVQ